MNSRFRMVRELSGGPSVFTCVKMFRLNKRRKRAPPLLLLTAFAAALASCDDDTSGPDGFPDASGDWVGQYSITSCSLDGAADPFFCDEVFFVGASLILDLSLEQNGPELIGLIAQGQLLGDVDGFVDENGLVDLQGTIGLGDTLATTFILGWQTGLAGDSLVGSWRFRTEDNSGSGFGATIVDATLALLGPSVTGFFGCAVEGAVALDGQADGSLERGDCMLFDNSYFDVYSFSGAVGDSVEVNLRSSTIDAFLLVADDDDEVLGDDDDSGGGINGTDSQLILVFDAAATVLLVANSFSGLETGTYNLSVVDLGPSGVASDRSGPARSEAVRVVKVGGSTKEMGPPRSPVERQLTSSRRLKGDLSKRH